MTPILATCPHADRCDPSMCSVPRLPSGFTLLEMVVVLAILGLVTALAAPSLLRTISTWQRQAQVDAVLDEVRALPGRARSWGADIHLDNAALAAASSPLSVPDGWSLSVPSPWHVQGNGVCLGGELLLGDGGRTWRIAVDAPFCEPRLLAPGSS